MEDNFRECYPDMKLINPALEQANAVKAYLAEQNALNPQKKGKFIICTSGDPQVYVNVGKRLELFEVIIFVRCIYENLKQPLCASYIAKL